MSSQIDRPTDRKTTSSGSCIVCVSVCVYVCKCVLSTGKCRVVTDIFFCHLLYPTLSLSACLPHCRCLLIAGERCAWWKLGENGKKGEGKLQLSCDMLRSCIAHAAVINMSHPAYKLLLTYTNQAQILSASLMFLYQINCNAQTICSNLPMCIQISIAERLEENDDRIRGTERTGKWWELTVKCKLNGES